MSTPKVTNPTILDQDLGISAGLGPNYIGTESGASNALVATLTDGAGNKVTIQTGLKVLLKTANTLQAGANTFNLNGHGTDSIVNNNGNNLKTSFAVGAILDMFFNGTNWVLLNSTY